MATYLHDNEIYSKCGTPGFLAPELFGTSEEVKDKTSPQIDMFSVGVMFYFMLTNKFPFDNADHSEVYQLNKDMKISYNHDRFKSVDSSTLELLKAMLEPNKNLRITCGQALRHPYLDLKPSKFFSTSSELLEIDPENQEEPRAGNFTPTLQDVESKTSLYGGVDPNNENNNVHGEEACNLKEESVDDGILSIHMMAQSKLSDNKTVKSHFTRSIQSIMVTNSPFIHSGKRKTLQKNQFSASKILNSKKSPIYKQALLKHCSNNKRSRDSLHSPPTQHM